MPFKNILVPIDGSEYSQTAIDYALWLGKGLGARVTGQHVVDPRLADMLIAPEFAEELGFKASIEALEKATKALEKVGEVILDLFSQEAKRIDVRARTYLDVGYIVEEITKRADDHDLVIIGHRGKGRTHGISEPFIGSVAERVVVNADAPVLVAVNPLRDIKEIVVAYDGSEPARGALLLGERLASISKATLKAVTVIPSYKEKTKGELTIEQGQQLLKMEGGKTVFEMLEGKPAPTLLNYTHEQGGLLILGAYGYRTPEENVLGSTTAGVIRRTRNSVLIYRFHKSHAEAFIDDELLAAAGL